jgi:predicted ArsR family transcriptional regulator
VTKQRALELLSDLQERTTGALAYAVGESRQAATSALLRALRQGLVSRRPYASGARPGYLYRLTDKGVGRLRYLLRRG